MLLVGGSSVGKTRPLYEALLARLPDWWLVHPETPGEASQLTHEPRPLHRQLIVHPTGKIPRRSLKRGHRRVNEPRVMRIRLGRSGRRCRPS